MTISELSELISVILPVFNGEGTIEASAKSVLDQTYRNIELIITDDASDDKTAEILRRLAGQDSRIKIITNSTNRPDISFLIIAKLSCFSRFRLDFFENKRIHSNRTSQSCILKTTFIDLARKAKVYYFYLGL